jgi:hypothetical protein
MNSSRLLPRKGLFPKLVWISHALVSKSSGNKETPAFTSWALVASLNSCSNITTVCKINIENKFEEGSAKMSEVIGVLQPFFLVVWSFPHPEVRNDGC